MAEGTPPAITLADLRRIADAGDPLTTEQVQDYAITALVMLRGLSRTDKFKVLRRMRKVMG